MNAKYLLYANGNSTMDTLSQFPEDLLLHITLTRDTPMIVPIPISPDYGEMEDNSTKVEYNPQPDDRLFVCAKIPKDDLSMWTTYCHIIAKHMTEVKTPNLQLKCVEDSIYAFLYQDEKNELVLKDVIEKFVSTHDNENESLDMNNLSICELLQDYINHIYTDYMAEEVSDFRHTYVHWTVILPTDYVENENIEILLNMFVRMNMYKYGQYSDPHCRLLGISRIIIPHGTIDTSTMEYYMSCIDEEIKRNNLKMIHRLAGYGFIWFCGKNANSIGYTDEESEVLIKDIKSIMKDMDDNPFPIVESCIKQSPQKDPDMPIMIHTIGSSISKVDNSLADGMEEIVGALYEYINEEE
jgi:hypothetical protein